MNKDASLHNFCFLEARSGVFLQEVVSSTYFECLQKSLWLSGQCVGCGFTSDVCFRVAMRAMQAPWVQVQSMSGCMEIGGHSYKVVICITCKHIYLSRDCCLSFQLSVRIQPRTHHSANTREDTIKPANPRPLCQFRRMFHKLAALVLCQVIMCGSFSQCKP